MAKTKLWRAVFLTLMILSVLGISKASAETPPGPFDMATLLRGYHLDPSGVANSIFSTGIMANVRIPPEHIRVAFYDSRTGQALSRDDRRHILGQVRQDWSHDLIRQVATNLPLPGGIEPDNLIDIFDAAAIASMRRPPEYVTIEFYDARRGATGDMRGGVSGVVPDYAFSASEGLRNGAADPLSGMAEARSRMKDTWTDEAIANELISRGIKFSEGGSDTFAVFFADYAPNHEVANNMVLHDFEAISIQLERDGSSMPIALINPNEPLAELIEISRHNDYILYIGYVPVRASVASLAHQARKEHADFY